jgi:glutamate---cysteine ligase / carboxylate-amine ligase
MTKLPSFDGDNLLTIGVELELQLVNLHNFNLTMEAQDLLRRVSETNHPGEFKPEITQSMIEINSSVHKVHSSLLAELCEQRDILVEQASQMHIGICGGGTHPFHRWQTQKISPTERYANVSEQYGYLAKQFSVFGQHIHVSCLNGDDALYLCHAMVQYFPHFIALSASSPFNQGVGTSFDCSRLAIISAFPLSGTPPWILRWTEFEAFYEKLINLKVIGSMKDFYWDIRPKPEYRTVELRLCDTPLTVGKAADLAAYAQTLIHWLLIKRPKISREVYLTYLTNRFRAARYGLEAILVDPIKQVEIPLGEDIIATCNKLEGSARELGSLDALERIKESAHSKNNDASWLKETYANSKSMGDMVRAQCELWKEG